jgi:3-deoxy-D-manno-octulosonic-acid transferase
MRVLYNILFVIAFFLYIPKLLGMCFFRTQHFSMLLKKLGLIRQLFFPLKNSIWIHAVSLGEVKASYPLLLEIAKTSNQPIAVSCVTQAGFEQACKYKPLVKEVVYLPFDFSWLVKSLIKMIDPSIFILVEGDFWPELLSLLKDRQVPVMLVNGKRSDKSFKNYLRYPIYTSWLFSKIDTFCVQSDQYKDLFNKLGLSVNLFVTGNMKFEYPLHRSTSEEIEALKHMCGFKREDRLIVIASTHPHEELKLISCLKDLLEHDSRLKLILVPRHAYRFDEVATMLKRLALSFSRLSSPRSSQILLVDQMGVLCKFYEIASLAIVGGSFEKIGGHNILEPLFYGVPTLFGPHMHKQKTLKEIALNLGFGVESSYDNIAKDARQILDGCTGFSKENISKILNTHQGCAMKNWLFAKKLLNFSQ